MIKAVGYDNIVGNAFSSMSYKTMTYEMFRGLTLKKRKRMIRIMVKGSILPEATGIDHINPLHTDFRGSSRSNSVINTAPHPPETALAKRAKREKNLKEKAKYQCNRCRKMYTTATWLKKHEQNVHGNDRGEPSSNKSRMFGCDQCASKYAVKAHLMSHKLKFHKLDDEISDSSVDESGLLER